MNVTSETATGTPRIVIEATDLKKYFTSGGDVLSAIFGIKGHEVRAVDGVDLRVHEGEVLGLVGESGSGKSTTGMNLVRLVPETSGSLTFFGESISGIKGAALKEYRRRAQMVFQDPYGSLNPRLTVAEIIEEPLRIHGMKDRALRAQKVLGAMKQVRLPPADYLKRFPFELSGGERQRVAIARAIVLEPSFIVADEPVSMLDVSVQAGVLELLHQLSKKMKMAVLYVSHDIATVRYICDRVAVMYQGRIVEEGRSEDVITDPHHPYTRLLMAAVPSTDPTSQRERVTSDLPASDAVCPQADGHWIDVSSGHRYRCPDH